MLENMRIGPRLIAAFMVLVLISVVIGVVGLYGAGKIDDKADEMYSKELMGLSHIKEANIKLISIGRARSTSCSQPAKPSARSICNPSRATPPTRWNRWRRPSRCSSPDRAKELFSQIDETWAAVRRRNAARADDGRQTAVADAQ